MPPDSTLRIRYYHQDHLSSTSVLTDAAGNLVEETGNYPFGQTRQQIQPRHVTESYRFTQNETDSESGFYNFRARAAIPSVGRFVRADPFLSSSPMQWKDTPQKQNVYTYCENRPLVYVDPGGDADINQVKSGLYTALKGFGATILGFSGVALGIAEDYTGIGVIAGVPTSALSALAASGGMAGIVLGGAQAYSGWMAKGNGQGSVDSKEIDQANHYLALCTLSLPEWAAWDVGKESTLLGANKDQAAFLSSATQFISGTAAGFKDMNASGTFLAQIAAASGVVSAALDFKKDINGNPDVDQFRSSVMQSLGNLRVGVRLFNSQQANVDPDISSNQ